jgi:hypothetical protein
MPKAKKSKSRIFVVPHAGYPFDVMVAIGATDEEVFRALDKKLADPLTAEQRDLLVMRGRGRTVMLLPCGQAVLRLVDTEPGTLAHEVFHVVHYLMDHVGIRLSFDSHEAFAYAIGNLTARIAEGIRANR